MKYTYYRAFTSNKHLLFAEEIQEALLCLGYTLTTSQIHALMRNGETEKVYYKTRMGLKKVYELEKILAYLEESEDDYQ